MTSNSLKVPPKPTHIAGNLTPFIELGNAWLSPNDSEEDEPTEARAAIPSRPGAGDELEPEDTQETSESQGLLSDPAWAAQRAGGAPKPGWITVLGFTVRQALMYRAHAQLPTPLLYLFAVPPILIIASFTLKRLTTHGVNLPILSNGTHTFHPTTLLISLDGFRPSYLETHPEQTKNLHALANSPHGLRAESMQPRFPTLTFPNHWSLLTGLYPESHGIIANDFWDPVSKEMFMYTHHEHSWDAHWWWGEPMWSVAQRAGRIAANIMWPGPPRMSSGISPDYFVQFSNIKPREKLTQFLEWLNLPISTRPQLITLYIPDVDQIGHGFGPDSQEVTDAVHLVDEFVGEVVQSIAERNLTEIINVIVVSDHGMTGLSKDRLVFLDDILGDAYHDIEHRDGLRFKDGSPNDDYLQVLRQAAEKSDGSFAVYTRETMPERWHFNRTERISPIFMVPKLGWAITDHHEFDVVKNGVLDPKGNHGYDNTEQDMQAIFYAHGPFATQLKDASSKRESGWVSTSPHVMKPFSNLELFSLVMRLLDLQEYEPAHNGTEGFWDNYLLNV